MAHPALHVRSVVDRDGAIILDIAHNSLLTLNYTAGYVWDRLQQGKLVDDIVRELANDTGEDIAVVDRDVHAFIEQLRSKRLITG